MRSALFAQTDLFISRELVVADAEDPELDLRNTEGRPGSCVRDAPTSSDSCWGQLASPPPCRQHAIPGLHTQAISHSADGMGSGRRRQASRVCALRIRCDVSMRIASARPHFAPQHAPR